MFVFRLYVGFETTQKQGFDILLVASNEKEAIIKAKKVVCADKFIIREVTQKTLWEKLHGQYPFVPASVGAIKKGEK